MLGQVMIVSRPWGAVRALGRAGIVGVLLMLGLTAFGDGAIAQPSSDALISIGSIATDVRSATVEVRLGDGVAWSDQQTLLNGIDISDLVAAGAGKVRLNVIDHPLRYDTNRLLARARRPHQDGAGNEVAIDLRIFNLDLPPVYDLTPRSPLIPVSTRVVPPNPSDLKGFQVTVGGKSYSPNLDLAACPTGSWLWFVVLSRGNQLNLKENEAFSSCEGVLDQTFVNKYLDTKKGQQYIVIVNLLAVGTGCEPAWNEAGLAVLQVALKVFPPIIEPSGGCQYLPWSAIGVPSKSGLGFQNSSALRDASGLAAANLQGGFALNDVRKDFDFVQTDAAMYDTRALRPVNRLCQSTAINAIYVDGDCYDADPLGQSVSGGFQIVVVDRASLELESNRTFQTGSTFWDDAQSQINAMRDALDAVREHHLVFIASIGEQPFSFDPIPDVPFSAFYELAFSVERVGGTPETIIGLLNQPGNYSLVGTQIPVPSLMPESSSVIASKLHVNPPGGGVETVPNPGRLRGVLTRGLLNRWFETAHHTIVDLGDISLATIVARDPEDWPVPRPDSVEERAAYTMLANDVFDCAPEASAPVVCSDPRDLYDEQDPPIEQWLDRLDNAKCDATDVACAKVLNQVKNEITALQNVTTMQLNIGHLIGRTQDADGLTSGVVIEKFEEDPTVPKDSKALVIAADVVKLLGVFAGISTGDPAFAAFIGGVGTAMKIASSLTRTTEGGNFILRQCLNDIKNDVNEQLYEQMNSILHGVNLQSSIVKGDWGKLWRAANVWTSAPFNQGSDLETAMVDRFRIAYQQHLAEQLTKRFYAGLQRANMLGLDEFYSWGDWDQPVPGNFREGFWSGHVHSTQHGATIDGDPKLDVILIKRSPLFPDVCCYADAPPDKMFPRPFADLLSGLLTDDLGLREANIFRRWDLTWTRCDWIKPGKNTPFDCYHDCVKGREDGANCARLPGSPVTQSLHSNLAPPSRSLNLASVEDSCGS